MARRLALVFALIGGCSTADVEPLILDDEPIALALRAPDPSPPAKTPAPVVEVKEVARPVVIIEPLAPGPVGSGLAPHPAADRGAVVPSLVTRTGFVVPEPVVVTETPPPVAPVEVVIEPVVIDQEGWFCRKNGVDLRGADEGVLLVGRQPLSRGGRRSIAAYRRGAEARLVACWHGLVATDAFFLERALPVEELEALLKIPGENREILLDDWKYRVRVVRRTPLVAAAPVAPKRLPPKRRGKRVVAVTAEPPEPAPDTIVPAMLDLRRRYIQDARLTLFFGDKIDVRRAPRPSLWIEDLASHELSMLLSRGKPRDFDWEEIAALAKHPNRTVVATLIGLLSDDRFWISGAAASALAQIRGVPLSTSGAEHLAWWKKARETYSPQIPAPITSLRALSRGECCFVEIHFDAAGDLWARAGTISKIYKYHPASDSFGESINLAEHVDPLQEVWELSGFEQRAGGRVVWVSRDERFEVELPSPERRASPENALRFVEREAIKDGEEFRDRETIVPLAAGTRSQYPVIGRGVVALSRAGEKGWSDPQRLVLLSLPGGSEKDTPLPPAALVRAVAAVEGGFLVVRDERKPLDQRAGAVEIYFVAENGRHAERLFAGSAERDEIFQVWPHALPDGSAVLVTLESRDAEGRKFAELGWLSIPNGVFSSILARPKESGSLADARKLSATISGDKVALIDDDQIYLWQR